MGGIYIKDIDMPTEYGRCMVIFPDGRVTTEFGSQVIATAVPVPPHGDLIDRDKFCNTVFVGEQCLYSWDELEDAIDYAPTIIPADGDKED